MMLSTIVERILANNEKARNSDKYLLLKVWEEHGLYLTQSQAYKFFSCPSSESIRRVRQKLQESGKYPATDRIARYRRHKSMVVQQRIPTTRVEKVEPLLEEPQVEQGSLL